MAVIPITKEAERTWDEIPSDGRSCTNRTETFYHQAWPFNSYIDDRKEAIQSIVAQIVPPASIAEDFLNVDDNIIEYIDGAFNVMMGGVSPIKVINSTMKYITSFWKKKKESAPVAIDEWNGNRPAGCLSIAFLQLLYYYKDVPSVKKGFPTLNRLYKYYNVETNQNSKYFGRFCRKNKETEDYEPLINTDVTIVREIMEKICKAIPVSVFTEKGTAVLPIFVKQAAENLGFKEFREPLDSPSNEEAARLIYQSLCNDIIPIAFQRRNGGHYYLIDGCQFTPQLIENGKNYDKACYFNYNKGWGEGSCKYAAIIDSMTEDIGTCSQNHISKLYFFAPPTKIYTTYVKVDEDATDAEKQLAISKRTAFDNLVGNNYTHCTPPLAKFRKGEVVYVKNTILENGLAVVVSNAITENNITYYRISYATKNLQDLLAQGGSTTSLGQLARQLTAMKLNKIKFVSVDNLDKVFSNKLSSLFIWERNGIDAKGHFYVKEFAVGQHIFNEPTLMTQSWLIRTSDAYISKIYDDGTCDVYFPYNKKTYHSYLPFNGSYVEHYEFPSTTSIPAQFKTDDRVWYKLSENDGFWTTIREGGVFIINGQRTYWIKNQGGTGLQYAEEKNLYKPVYVIDPDKFY